MNKLAPVIGVSATIISQACKEHLIPVPPQGYWSKVRTGRKMSKPQLPSRPLGMSNIVKLGRPRSVGLEWHPDVDEPLDDVRKRVAEAIDQQFTKRTPRPKKLPRSDFMWQSLADTVVDFRGNVLVDPDNSLKAVVSIYHQQISIGIVEAEPKSNELADVSASHAFEVIMARRACSKEIWRKWKFAAGVAVEEKLAE